MQCHSKTDPFAEKLFCCNYQESLVPRNVHARVINMSLGATVLLFNPLLHSKYLHPIQILVLFFPTPSVPTGEALQKQPERSLCGAEIAI